MKPGWCICILLGQQIKHGNNDKRTLHKHSSDPDHVKYFKDQEFTYILPGATPTPAPSYLSDRIADQIQFSISNVH